MKKTNWLKVSILVVLTGAAVALQAQTLHEVTISGNAFEPSSLIIHPGDMVRWSNSGGFHNVNGTKAIYPGNSESFGNSLSAANWVFEHTFQVVGDYDYRCDAHFGSGMVGTVTVQDVNTPSGSVQRANHPVLLYPSPAKQMLTVDCSGIAPVPEQMMLEFIGVTGFKSQLRLQPGSSVHSVQLSELPAGIYFTRVYSPLSERLYYSGKLVVE